jgi:hypothetical protein
LLASVVSYTGIIRNQLHIPELDCNMCTLQFLLEVYNELVFVWKMPVQTFKIATVPNLKELQALTV